MEGFSDSLDRKQLPFMLIACQHDFQKDGLEIIKINQGVAHDAARSHSALQLRGLSLLLSCGPSLVAVWPSAKIQNINVDEVIYRYENAVTSILSPIVGKKLGKGIYCSRAKVYPRASVTLAYCKVMSVKWHINGHWF